MSNSKQVGHSDKVVSEAAHKVFLGLKASMISSEMHKVDKVKVVRVIHSETFSKSLRNSSEVVVRAKDVAHQDALNSKQRAKT